MLEAPSFIYKMDERMYFRPTRICLRNAAKHRRHAIDIFPFSRIFNGFVNNFPNRITAVIFLYQDFFITAEQSCFNQILIEFIRVYAFFFRKNKLLIFPIVPGKHQRMNQPNSRLVPILTGIFFLTF